MGKSPHGLAEAIWSDGAAVVRAVAGAQGAPIGACDVLIAGQARARELTFVTRNLREFGRVAGLAVEDRQA